MSQGGVENVATLTRGEQMENQRFWEGLGNFDDKDRDTLIESAQDRLDLARHDRFGKLLGVLSDEAKRSLIEWSRSEIARSVRMAFDLRHMLATCTGPMDKSTAKELVTDAIQLHSVLMTSGSPTGDLDARWETLAAAIDHGGDDCFQLQIEAHVETAGRTILERMAPDVPEGREETK